MEKKKIKLQEREVFTAGAVSLREAQDSNGIIEGVAIVTNKETVLYECADFREVEVIDPSCLSPEFIRQQDIKLNLLHNRDESIARTPQSLRVFTREDGLHFEADVPDCDLGQRAKALIANGTYTGCSFEFRAKDYEVKERIGSDGKAEYVIRHKAFEKISALTIAMDPVYSQTSVNAREIYQSEHNREVEVDETTRLTDEQSRAEAEREYNHRKRQLQIKQICNY